MAKDIFCASHPLPQAGLQWKRVRAPKLLLPGEQPEQIKLVKVITAYFIIHNLNFRENFKVSLGNAG